MAQNSHGSRTQANNSSNTALRQAIVETLEQRQMLSGATDSGEVLLQHVMGPSVSEHADLTQKQLNAIQTAISNFEKQIRTEVRTHPHKQQNPKFQAQIEKQQNTFAAKIAKRGGTYTPIPYSDLLVGSVPVVAPALTGSVTSSTSITLTWNAITSAQHYTVQTSVNGSNWSNLATVTTPTYISAGLKSDTVHKYRVTATVSGRTSPVSNVVTLTTLLPAPTTFRATVNSATSVGLAWTSVTHATSYKIERSPNNTTWTALTPSPALTTSSTSFVDTTASAGSSYYYRLTAIETQGTSAASTAVQVLTLPAVPVVTATATSATVVTLNWAAITGAATYNVQTSNDGGNTWTTLATPTAITYANTALTADTAHKYRVSAVNATGSSAPSSVVTITTLLAGPTGLTASAASTTDINLSWNPVTDATGFKLERSVDQVTWTTLTISPVLSGGAVSYSDTGVSAGTTYYYRISALDLAGTSAASTVTHALTYPAAPTLTATISSATQINLSWTSSSSATSYLLQTSTDGGNTWSTLASPTTTTYNNTALTADTGYAYRVTAINATGNSVPSATVSKTTLLASPAGLAATAVSATEIDLTWTAETDATGYKLERSPDNTTWATLTPSPALTGASSTYADTGLTAGTTYYYRLSGIDASGTSAASTAVHALTIPAVPTLTATVGSSTVISLTWVAVKGAASYTLQSSSNGGNTWATISSPTTNTYSNTGLTADTQYQYRLSAVDATGSSAPSTVVTISTALPAPAGLTATAVSATEVNLAWTAETDATNYKIERSPDQTTWTTLTPSPALNGGSAAYADTSVSAGTTYYYRISAIDAAGTSSPSTVANALTFAAAPVLTATVTSATAVNLTWVAIKSATTYTVQSSTDGGFTWGTLASPTTTSYSNTALTADTQYAYRVIAVNGTGSSPASSVQTVTTFLVSPLGLSATAVSATAINLTWTAEFDATSYKIERSLNQTTWTTLTPSPALTGASTSFADTTASAGTTYYYRISGLDAAGSSVPAAIVHTLTFPAAPTVAGTVTSATQINLTWVAIPSATSYQLEASADGGITWTTFASQTTLTYSNTALTADTQYKYQLTATNAGGTSASSSILTLKTILGAPTNLALTPASATEIDLTWTAEADATNYKLERSTNNTTWTTITPSPALSGTSASYADTGLTAGTTYYYRISGINSVGTSVASTVVSILTLPATPVLSGTLISGSEIDLSWTAISSATVYTVQISTDGGTTWTVLGSPTTTTFKSVGLTPDTPYKYRLSVSNGAGASLFSNVVSLTTLLATPTGFTVTPSISPTEINLAWTPVADATTYKVERSVDNITWTTLAPATPLVGTSDQYLDTQTSAGTLYYYRISAVNAVGTSAPTPVETGLSLPGTSTLSGSAASATSIALSWTAVTGATSYLLEQSANSGTTWTTAATQAGTKFTATGLTADTSYEYRVTASDATGAGTTSGVQTISTVTLAPASFTVTASSSSDTTINLAWTAMTDATGYKIERSLTGTAWTTLTPSPALAGTAAAYADTTVAAGTTYFYRISAIDPAGTSAPATVASALTIPATPTLTANVFSATAVNLSWTAVTGATNYVLERSANAGTTWATAATQAGTTFSDTALTADTAYEYEVIASDATGPGGTSSVSNITTLLNAPAGFTVTADASSPTEIDLAWTATTDATTYSIQRSLNNSSWTTLTPATPLVGTSAAYADTSVLAGTLYYYRISGVDAAGISAPTTSASALTIPVAPTLSATAASATSVSLSWNAVKSATGYVLGRSANNGTTWTTAATQAGTTFADTGLTADTAYEYEVIATNATGPGLTSATASVTTFLGAVTGFGVTASTSSDTTINLAWTAVTDATGYQIQRSLNNSVWTTLTPSPALAGTAAAYADTSVLAGTTYYYRIAAVNAVGASAFTASANGLTIPGTPTLTATAASATSVSLSWTTQTGATSYVLERSANAGTTWATAATQAGATFTDTALTADTAYEYEVTAANATGAGTTSSVANVTTILGTVTGLTATASSSIDTTVNLAWTAVTDATGYQIQRSLNQALWTTLSISPALAGTAAAYADTSVLAGTTYYYRISAVNSVGASAPTAAASALTIPATPTLAASPASATSVSLTWNAVTGATSYLVERSANAGTAWSTAATQAGTTFTDTALTADTAYEYEVTAVDATGPGTTSSVVNVTTILGAVTGFTATASSSTGTEIDLAWTAVTDATGYQIQRSINNSVWTTLSPSPALAGTAAAYADTSVLAGNTYYYRISGVNAVGTSAPTASASALTLAATPTLIADATSATSIHLSWTPSFGATSYLLEKSINAGTAWTTAATQAGTSFDDTALTADSSYEYRVSAIDATGTSSASTVSTVTTILGAVTGFTVTASTSSSTEIDLAWTAVTDATGYVIERSLNQSIWTVVTPSPALAGTAASYADTTVSAGTTYYYTIAAVNAVGTSAPTAAASALTIPAATTLSVSPDSATQVDLSWTPVQSATSYLVEKSVDGGTTWTTAATLATTVFSDTGLAADTSYEYEIVAINATGSSSASTVQTVTTIVNAPSGLTATQASDTEIDLAWTAVTDATGYIIERSFDNIAWDTLTPSPALAGTAAAYADTTVVPGTLYYYRISAVNANGVSVASTVAMATTPLAAPTGLAASNVSASQNNVTWTNDTDAGLTGFIIQSSTDDMTWTSLATLAPGTTTFSDVRLAASTQYYYRLIAVNAGGSSAASATATATTPA